ncbi:hypothetical protein ACIBCS_39375 [Streptomyces phaeochromogenes]|uniref:hypothetical protein n=1 Tax=Streptomyces phaeochromogenes TaxID=1923 RepID=UPI0033D7D62A
MLVIGAAITPSAMTPVTRTGTRWRTTAVGAALTEYVITALRADVPQDLHESFMHYLRAIIRAARPG